jgi:hypothetical protein
MTGVARGKWVPSRRWKLVILPGAGREDNNKM